MEWMRCNDCNWEGLGDQLHEQQLCPECFLPDVEEVDLEETLAHRATTIILPSCEEVAINNIKFICDGKFPVADKLKMIQQQLGKIEIQLH